MKLWSVQASRTRSPSRRKSAWIQLSSWVGVWAKIGVEISDKRITAIHRMDFLLLFLSPLGARALFGFRGGPLSRSVLVSFRGFVGDRGNLYNRFGYRSWHPSLPFGILMGKVNGFGNGANVAGGFSFGSDGFYVGFDFVTIAQGKFAFRFAHVFNLRFQQRSHRAIRVVGIFRGLRYVDENHDGRLLPCGTLPHVIENPHFWQYRPEVGTLVSSSRSPDNPFASHPATAGFWRDRKPRLVVRGRRLHWFLAERGPRNTAPGKTSLSLLESRHDRTLDFPLYSPESREKPELWAPARRGDRNESLPPHRWRCRLL